MVLTRRFSCVTNLFGVGADVHSLYWLTLIGCSWFSGDSTKSKQVYTTAQLEKEDPDTQQKDEDVISEDSDLLVSLGSLLTAAKAPPWLKIINRCQPNTSLNHCCGMLPGPQSLFVHWMPFLSTAPLEIRRSRFCCCCCSYAGSPLFGLSSIDLGFAFAGGGW